MVEKTPDTLIVKDGKNNRELFMSFGLLHELLGRIGDITNISVIAIDPQLRTDILRSVLAERNDLGHAEDFVLFSLQIGTEDIQKILQWVADHTLDFFLTAIETNLSTHTRHQGRLTGSMASTNGSAS